MENCVKKDTDPHKLKATLIAGKLHFALFQTHILFVLCDDDDDDYHVFRSCVTFILIFYQLLFFFLHISLVLTWLVGICVGCWLTPSYEMKVERTGTRATCQKGNV